MKIAKAYIYHIYTESEEPTQPPLPPFDSELLQLEATQINSNQKHTTNRHVCNSHGNDRLPKVLHAASVAPKLCR